METFDNERASLPRNMIENSMFEEEPDVVDLAKESPSYPLDPDDVVYEPRSSRLLVRGLGENDMDEDEEEMESSARLLGMSFMNRSSNQRSTASAYIRQTPSGSCSMPSTKTLVIGVFILVLVASMVMVIYFLPGCTFTRAGCRKNSSVPLERVYPISTSGDLFPWTEPRLPASVRPVHYDLSLHPNLTTMIFQGNVSIRMLVLQDAKKIVLHSSGLKIDSCTLQGKRVKILEYKPWEQIAVECPKELKKGQEYVLSLEYSANLSNSYEGFYNSSYHSSSGIGRLAATQFEPVAARKAFPCFDEPAFKATFSIKIKRESGYVSLSNMPKLKSTDLTNGLFEDEFETFSVNMSTYLVAFIVANFTSVSANVSNINVSVYAVPEKRDQMHYALEKACDLLKFYNQFFEIDYPLKKLDLVAIPDFLAGAMENWGLITFRETTLLVGNHSSPLDKQLVASVIAHELAHQWFGNLVTMRWWNDLWLNEGFATYMQYMSIEKIFPELEIDDDFLSMRFRTLAKDSLNSSHPVSNDVTTPEQVSEMFDPVSYVKGASMLLMINSTLGEQGFRKGIIEYLNKYNGGNTESADLWNSFPSLDLNVVNVTEMMNTWTKQKGFPLVTVKRTGTEVTVSQEPFLLNADNSSRVSSLWHVPLTYVNDSCSNADICKQVFHLNSKTATFKVPAGVKWLKFNFRGDGFYIVQYEDGGWQSLTDALRENVSVLTHEDRASLINNVFALSRLGKVSFRQVLNVLAYVTNETDAAPVTEALTQLTRIYRMLEKRSELKLAARMKSYIFEHFKHLMDDHSWEEETSISKQLLRSSVLETACSLGQENCTRHAESVFKEWLTSNKTKQIPGDLLKTVFSVAAQSDDDWGELLETYKYSIFDSEKRKILEAMSSTNDVRKIIWLLKEGLDGGNIQTQELPLVIETACQSFGGYLHAWNFVKENWDKLTEKFPIGSFSLQRIIMSTTSQFSTEMHLDEVQNFLSSLKEKGSQMRSAQEAVETIRLNIRWMEENLDTLRKAL
ncbi:leucyl-cystinyl aminopeptidase isoform X2 [Chanos chanos]|uniref:Leucyl-cystinyl aminopeptidase isoform X2 n=1 Tax=Chanos chanos TaxID=29144 RepID=A0A6J2WT84_CHACN|nr:leucyl-cystinyl aminopeptidase isoform X2 [Chanos chanos]